MASEKQISNENIQIQNTVSSNENKEKSKEIIITNATNNSSAKGDAIEQAFYSLLPQVEINQAPREKLLLNDSLKIEEFGLKGKGVLLIKDAKKGDFTLYEGTEYSQSEAMEMLKNDKKAFTHFIGIRGAGIVLDGSTAREEEVLYKTDKGVGQLVNHPRGTDAPANCKYVTFEKQNKIAVVLLQDIQASNEIPVELTASYGTLDVSSVFFALIN